MLESFFAAVRVVVPMTLLMALGVIVRRGNVIDRPSMTRFDRLVFRLFMPVLLFKNIYEVDWSRSAGLKEILFIVVSLSLIFTVALFLPPRLTKVPGKAASLGQAMVRSNYILFGITVAEALYGSGNVGTVALLGALVVPVTNAMGVVVIELHQSRQARFGEIVLSIFKNPMVIATIAALSFKVFAIHIPEVIWEAVKSVAGATTTVSFISLGVGLDMNEVRADGRLLVWGVLVRMVAIPLLFLPFAVALGFRGETLCAMMILFAAPVAVASYPMAVAMGADGQLAGQLVCASTLLSVFTIFCFTFLFKSLGML